MGLLKSTFVVSGNTLLSRISGLVRDMVVAHFFEVGKGTDAFFIAFKIPNFLRRLFGEGAFSQAFVPVLSEYKVKRSKDEVTGLISSTAGTLGAVLLLLCIISYIGAPLIVTGIAWGFIDQPEKLALTSDMFKITIWYILFISLTALSSGVLNSYGKFGVPAFTPILLNLCLIIGTFLFHQRFDEPVKVLAWGVFVAGILQFAWQLPFIARLGLLRLPKWGWRDSGVRKILRLMGPGILGSSVMQINLLFDIFIASFLITGSITWLYYADRMLEFPLGVFGIAMATVILPHLSAKHASSDPREFSHTIDWAMRWVLIIGVPASVALYYLAEPVLSTLFLHGKFKAYDISMMALALQIYTIGLVAHMFVKILAPGYFARQDTKTPVKYAMVALFTNMILNVVFVVTMLQLDIKGAHAGLALATACSGIVNAGLLWWGLRKQGVLIHEKAWFKLLAQVFIATLAMFLVLYFLTGDKTHWYGETIYGRIAQLAIIVPAGILTYFLIMRLTGLKLSELRKPG